MARRPNGAHSLHQAGIWTLEETNCYPIEGESVIETVQSGRIYYKEASSRREPIEYLTQVALEIDRARKDTISMDT
jgi:hypothetical protein